VRVAEAAVVDPLLEELEQRQNHLPVQVRGHHRRQVPLLAAAAATAAATVGTTVGTTTTRRHGVLLVCHSIVAQSTVRYDFVLRAALSGVGMKR
jgi:hypothetical protein